MRTKVLFIYSLIFSFFISIDAQADCTPTDIPGICLENAPNIPDGGISEGLKAGVKGVEQLGKDTIGGTIKTVEKAGGDIVQTTVKTANDLTATYTKAWADGTEQARRSFQDTVDAANAVGNYASNQAKDLVQAGPNAVKRAQEGKFVDAIWHLSTEPLQASEKNFAQAAQESTVINSAAQTAANVYGGPGGAAAYTAWATYRSTGNADLALRAGILSALTSQTGGSVENMPSGTVGELLKKSAMAGAVGGIAVAAAGGDEQAVKDAFLKSSGAVLIQGSTDKLKAFSPKAKDAADMINCISAKDVDCVSNTTYARDLKGRFLYDKNGKPRIDTNKLDPKQYFGQWTGIDLNSPEGQKLGLISKISKLPKIDAMPLKNNQWVLTWTLGRDKTLEYGKPAVVLTYVGNDVPFISKVDFESFITDNVYLCPVPGFTRTVTTTKSENSCKTIYRREGGISQPIWHSHHNSESCAAKAAAFVAQLSSRGTFCTASSKVKSKDSSSEDLPRVTGTVGGREVVPGPSEPITPGQLHHIPADIYRGSDSDRLSEPSEVVPIPADPYR